MKKFLDIVYTCVMTILGLLFVVFVMVVFGSCSSSNDAAADNYIKELEATLEMNNISIDDTVGGSDAYADYYMNK